MILLDSGAVTRLARRNDLSEAIIVGLRRAGEWPPAVPTAVLVECLTGRPGPDVLTNRLLRICEVVDRIPEGTARRAARLRALARRGSAVDTLLVAMAEPGGSVLTGDLGDLGALASHAEDVVVRRV